MLQGKRIASAVIHCVLEAFATAASELALASGAPFAIGVAGTALLGLASYVGVKAHIDALKDSSSQDLAPNKLVPAYVAVYKDLSKKPVVVTPDGAQREKWEAVSDVLTSPASEIEARLAKYPDLVEYLSSWSSGLNSTLRQQLLDIGERAALAQSRSIHSNNSGTVQNQVNNTGQIGSQVFGNVGQIITGPIETANFGGFKEDE